MESHIKYLDKEYRRVAKKLQRIIDANRVERTDTLIERAQEYTGLNSKGLKTLLKKAEVIKRREEFERKKKRANLFNFSSVAEYDRAVKKAREILKDFDDGYSMGSEKLLWLKCPGQEGSGSVLASIDTRQTYARSCKWQATHGHVGIRLTKREWNALEKIEGIWTIRDEETGEAKWLVEEGEKQYYELKWEEGYCVGTAHASTLEKARELNRRKKIKAKKAEKRKEQRIKIARRKFVGKEHFHKMGACYTGIKGRARKHGLDPDLGYRLDYLMELNDNRINSYIERMI